MSKSAHALVFCRLFFIHNFPCQLGRIHSLFFYFYDWYRPTFSARKYYSCTKHSLLTNTKIKEMFLPDSEYTAHCWTIKEKRPAVIRNSWK